jgi:3-deoxy-D-manno-oct-2-ulosonic acid (Kdo) hydroxylase
MAVRIERGELIDFPLAPFPLPDGDSLDFLLSRRTRPGQHKDVSFDPATNRLTGTTPKQRDQRQRIRDLLTAFAAGVATWLDAEFPEYRGGLTPDRVSLRTEEEATRVLRLTARNDLLHIDNFPTRPTRGRRILRVFANINPTEPRIWSTSETFPDLLARFAKAHRIPLRSREEWVEETTTWVSLFSKSRGRKTHYDTLMMRLHHFLKENDAVQSRAPRRIRKFPPGSAWLLMTDGLAHAQLRGRFALEHSFFVDSAVLQSPDDAPLAVLMRSGIA